nr:nucleotide-binding alpha-beta plait domain-containing protein [Tanacetum cinerariifolium]
MGHYSWDVIGGTSLWWDTRGGTTKMRHHRTKEDDVASISTSVYVTNFPESISAKDLFKACRQYGHVVDSFIPNKKSKTGKRFGFIKFINVFSEERLINNLCTVWIDRFKLHANIACFQRPMGKKEENGGKKPFVVPNGVKEFASLANLKVALANEGFMDITIKYMGELWVMMEFKSEDSLRKFKKCISVLTWFSRVTNATNEFEVEGRIARIEVEGIPFRLWTKNTFARIADKWGKLLDVDDQDDLCFHSKRLCVHMKSCKSIQEEFKIIHRGRGYWIRANETPEQKSAEFEENSDEEIVPDTIFEGDDVEKRVADEKKEENEMENSANPLNIYSLLNRHKQEGKKDNVTDSNLKYPPGFTPSGRNNGEDGSHMVEKVNDAQSNCCENPSVKGSGNGSISSGHFKVSEVPIRCDNGTEFKNAHIIELCRSKGIKREYSNARTPQQNRVAERKNKTLIEAARTMLADSKLPTMFWTEAVRTACYVLNSVLVTSPHNKTPYALLTGNIPSISHFKPFGCHVTILNTSDHLGKFDKKADEGYIVGYSASNKAYKVYNVPNKRVEETMNLSFLEKKPNVQGLGPEWYFDLDYLTDTLGYKHVQANHSASTQETTTNPAGTQDADSDSDYNEQVFIIPSYPSHHIHRTAPTDTSGDAVDDSPLNFANEIFQKELARLKVPPGSIPLPTGSIPVPSGDTMPTTRFLSPSDLGNHAPSPCIFSSLSYVDELGAALNNVASTVVVSPVATKRINTIHPQSLIIGDPTLVVQTRSKVKQTTTVESAFISYMYD